MAIGARSPRSFVGRAYSRSYGRRFLEAVRSDIPEAGVRPVAQPKEGPVFGDEEGYFATKETLFSYTVRPDGTAAITGCDPVLPEVVIPEKVNGLVVTALADRAFAECEQIVKITVPDTVDALGDFSLMFTGITTFDAPPGLRWIGKRAFYHCKNLEQINLPKTVQSVGQGAFEATAVRELHFSEALHFIGSVAFHQTNLIFAGPNTSLHIDEGSAYYLDEDGGLYEHMADGWTLVHMLGADTTVYAIRPNTVRVLNRAFANHKNIECIVCPEGLLEIGAGAFVNCSKLTKLVVPESLEAVGEDALRGTALTKFYISANMVDMNHNMFMTAATYSFDEPTIKKIEISPENETFYLQDGLLCKRGEQEGHDTAMFYAGPGGRVVIPENVTTISSMAFTGQAGIREIVLHDHIELIETCGFYFSAGLIFVTVCNAAQDGSDMTFEFPNCPAGIKSIWNAFEDNTVNVRVISKFADRAIQLTSDPFERYRLMCLRLCEPLWLSADAKEIFLKQLRSRTSDVCVLFARNSFLKGYDILAALEILTNDNFDAMLQAVTKAGEVAAVNQMLEVRRRRLGAPLFDFDL